MAEMTPIEIARFWSRVDHGTDFQCWHWKGATNSQGYGRWHRTGAHRVACELVHGPIPVGYVVRHKCDNPSCCNPKHLEVGTQAQNINDAVRRGRIAKGSRHGRSKLSDDDIAYIHQNPERLTITKIAQKLGVAKSTVSMIKSGSRRA